MPKNPEIDKLLAEDAWIRRMARRLVVDPARADDLVQDTWVAALKEPQGVRSPRAWLGGVLRNRWRSDTRSAGRRAGRERSVARSEALPSTADLVEEVTLRREVADHLLELEEPYRSTLYLRFFRDFSLKKIAREMDVSVSTAHTRLQHGLEQMRARLDRAHGGDRSAWALAMLPLAKSSLGLAATTVATPIGTIAMSTGVKLAVGVVVAGGAIGLWVQNRESRALEPVIPAPVVEETARAELLEPALEGTSEPVNERAAVAPVVPLEPAPKIAATTPAPMTVDGIVMDTSLQAIAGVEVAFVEDGASQPYSLVKTDSAGRFSLERPALENRGWEQADPLQRKMGGGEFAVRDSHFQTLSVGVNGNDDLVLVVEPRAEFAGVVLDEEGQPLRGAEVAVRVRRSLHRELGFSQLFAQETAGNPVISGEDGSFHITDSCGGSAVFLSVQLAGFEELELELPSDGDSDLVVTLERIDDTVDVTGRVIDADGAPVEGAQVSMGHTVEHTDQHGAFTVHFSRKEARESNHSVRQDDGVWVTEDVVLQISALKQGHLPARVDLEGADLEDPVVLQLGEGPLSITGVVVDAEGEPRAGVIVWSKNLTEFGKHIMRQGNNRSLLTLTFEEELRGGAQARGVVTAADGSFELSGLLEQDYELGVYDAATSEQSDGGTFPAGAEEVRLVLPRDPSVTRVSGRLVSTHGKPIADVMVSPNRQDRSTQDRIAFTRFSTPPDHLLVHVKTDEEGRFEFPSLATEGTSLLLFGSNIFFRGVSLANYEDLAHMEIVEPILCELQVELGDPGLATFLKVEDGRGDPIDMIESFGVFVAESPMAKIQEGRSGVLRVRETAETLVLYRGTQEEPEEVARRPLRLDPDRRTVMRP